jgi:hypothetical protein
MPIKKVSPYISLGEEDTNPLLDGSGSEIAIFIGPSNNPSPNSIGKESIKKYIKYAKAAKTVEAGGLGLDSNINTNPLLQVVKDFFIESAKTTVTDRGVSYCYTIDLGTNPTNELYHQALELCVLKPEIQVIGIIGFKTNDNEYLGFNYSFIQATSQYLKDQREKCRLQIAYFQAPPGKTDQDLINMTMGTLKEDGAYDLSNIIRNSRINIVENKYFGRTIARICLTPYYEEPGYNYYRTIEPASSDGATEYFIERTPEEEDALCEAGIIFNRDEEFLEPIRPCITLATSTAYANDDIDRPNDALLHARRNADHQLRQLVKIVSLQLKRNETKTNIRYVKSDCESYLDSEYKSGYIQNDYGVEITEAFEDPYKLYLKANITPVNSTQAILISAYIGYPEAKVSDELSKNANTN